MKAARKFAQKNITNRPYSQLIKDRAINKFLSDIGGDAMVNAFLINVKDNREASVVNELTSSVFRKLSYRNALNDCNKRVPMILTQSEKSASIGVGNLRKLKQRIGLNDSDDDVPISFLINTVLNPWLSSYEMVAEMGTYFREKVLLAIGELQDEPHNHGFISAGIISDEGLIYGDHLPVFTETVHQYHAIAKFIDFDGAMLDTVGGLAYVSYGMSMNPRWRDYRDPMVGTVSGHDPVGAQYGRKDSWSSKCGFTGLRSESAPHCLGPGHAQCGCLPCSCCLRTQPPVPQTPLGGVADAKASAKPTPRLQPAQEGPQRLPATGLHARPTVAAHRRAARQGRQRQPHVLDARLSTDRARARLHLHGPRRRALLRLVHAAQLGAWSEVAALRRP